MMPTRLALWLFALGLIPLMGGLGYAIVDGTHPAIGEALALIVLAWDLAVFLFFVLDGALASRYSSLRARRELPASLSVGVANEIVVVLENTGRRRVQVVVRDTPPPAFPAEPAFLSASVAAHTWFRAPYRLQPTDRGNFAFGDLYLRLRGPLGLAWADRTVRAAEKFQVYPNLHEVRRYEAMLRSALLRTGGYHIKRMPGVGREFSHFRDYNPDDDYRHVNWKATARRAKPITSVFESEHSQDIIFCLDIGRMMAARVGMLSKLDHAVNAILMLTHVSQRFQDNLGLLVFSHTVHQYLPPARSRSQYARFLQALYHVRPELAYVNYREAFEYLIARHPKRALTMVFTDLLDSVVSAEYLQAVQLLRRFHLPLTLAVADVPLQALAARVPTTTQEMYDILVARNLLHGRAELLGGLERRGIMVVDTVPERLTVDAVNRYLAFKTGVKI
jgi:uncharacterized protein (DUF58 family)